ncbi:SipW-dependent-type signal peptide-containing protein [Bacillus sp. FJAT-49705]|uniref:SipW-dependent-type signal peptide-containing protein n=1 Tax=Cytobacillus citreus TaxID=2833586 RepID=A0ABS5NXI3_9BACI|nr:TasA family protein [Cytobacillus citreus]MBS4192538.1 SipW-dependent-type signal peptide-containing protein [Cytobacillus citreus]
MSFKKKLGLGIAAASLGLSLVGGGTFAYFSDTEVTNNQFTAGTLDLAVNPEVIIDINNLKPGDWMVREFKLENKGSLDISKVLLDTDIEIIDAKGDNTEDLAKHFMVQFLVNDDKLNNVYRKMTLDKLIDNPDVVKGFFGRESGLKAGDSDLFKVRFVFMENKKDQNQFQGDSLKLKWTFHAEQSAGEER